MERKIKFLLVFILVAGLFVQGVSVFAQSATSQTWTSAIQYQNPNSEDGTLNVVFFDTSGGATVADPIDIDAYTSGTLLVGTVSGLGTNFEGSAVLQADVPIVANYRSFVSGSDQENYDFTITNGYSADNAGTTVYLATVLKEQFNSTSRFGIQNLDTVATNVTIEFFAVGAATPTHTITPTIPARSSYVASMADFAEGEIPAGFSGSLRATADNGTSKLVATSEETWDTGRQAYGFEGVSKGATKIYVPTMLSYFKGSNGKNNQMSYYAFQAVGGDVDIEMKHYDRDTGAQLGTTYTTTILDGNKVSLNPKTHGGVPNGSIGSSVIEVTGGTGSLLGIVKVYDSATGLLTSYTAESSYTVTSTVKLGLPFVVHEGWGNGDWNSYIAVQNIGTADATNVTATFYNSDGSVAIIETLADVANPLAPLQKANTGAHAAGTTFRGSVVISSDQPVTVANRLYKAVNLDGGATTAFSEDYTGQIFDNP